MVCCSHDIDLLKFYTVSTNGVNILNFIDHPIFIVLKSPLLNSSITDHESMKTRKIKTKTKTPLKGQRVGRFEQEIARKLGPVEKYPV